jgi:hypothetical protein
VHLLLLVGAVLEWMTSERGSQFCLLVQLPGCIWMVLVLVLVLLQ